MKKVGYFFFSFLPVLIALGIQFLASFFMMGISALLIVPSVPSRDVFNRLYDVWTNTDFNTGLMLVYALTCICVFGLWYYHSFGGNFLPERAVFHPMQLAAIAVLIPGTQFGCNFLTAILAAIFPDWLENYEELVESAGLANDISLIMLCYAVILAPICEELIFRGVIMQSARRALPFWLANTMQALLFGIFHMNMIQGCYAFALGLVLGYVCYRGGSIYYSIFMHFLFNFWGTIISQFLEGIDETLLILLMIGSTILSLSFGFLLFYFGGKRKEQKRLRSQAQS